MLLQSLLVHLFFPSPFLGGTNLHKDIFCGLYVWHTSRLETSDYAFLDTVWNSFKFLYRKMSCVIPKQSELDAGKEYVIFVFKCNK